MIADFQLRLDWLFERELKGAGKRENGTPDLARRHREREAPLLDYLTRWFREVKGIDRIFVPLDDPKQELLFPPVDGCDTDWEYVVECKQKNRSDTPESLDRKSGGIWVSERKFYHLLRLCGISQEVVYPFISGLIVYQFSNGEIYWLSVRVLADLIRKTMNGVLPPEQLIKSVHLPDNHELVSKYEWHFAVPSGHWCRKGNIKDQSFVDVPSVFNVDGS